MSEESGARSQGTGATAAGKRGVGAGGDINDAAVTTGDDNAGRDHVGGDMRSTAHDINLFIAQRADGESDKNREPSKVRSMDELYLAMSRELRELSEQIHNLNLLIVRLENRVNSLEAEVKSLRRLLLAGSVAVAAFVAYWRVAG